MPAQKSPARGGTVPGVTAWGHGRLGGRRVSGTLVLDGEGLSNLVHRAAELTEWLAAAEAEDLRVIASSVTGEGGWGPAPLRRRAPPVGRQPRTGGRQPWSLAQNSSHESCPSPSVSLALITAWATGSVV